jgi:ABC-type nickel/cobalt efflux system permease component RcnA
MKSLLALGVSGGLLPCPSALVVLLSAIAFHRVLFGMVLIVAFSLGLATTLTVVGLMVVYGGRILRRLQGARSGATTGSLIRAMRVLPVVSALVVAGLGSTIAIAAMNPGMLPSVLTSI